MIMQGNHIMNLESEFSFLYFFLFLNSKRSEGLAPEQ